MTDKPNFVLIPDDAPLPAPPKPVQTGSVLAQLRTMATAAAGAVASAAVALPAALAAHDAGRDDNRTALLHAGQQPPRLSGVLSGGME